MTILCIGPRERSYKGPYINTTSRSTNWSRGLSPFLLGPIDMYVHEGELLRAQSFENMWQFSKVHPQFDNNGRPSSEYWDWARKGWASPRGERYPMGKNARPNYAWWNGERLNYIEARKKIYAPLYAEAVVKTTAWETLKQIYDDLGEITLWDFDTYDHKNLGMTYRDVMNCETRKLGHGFVLAMLLEEDLAWL